MPVKRLFAVLVLSAIVSSTGIAITSGGIVGKTDGKLFIRAQNLTFKDVATAIHQEFDVEIKGLESLESEELTLEYVANSLEELVRGLLRHLNIKNYAFEFSEDRLITVNILPGARTTGSRPLDAATDSNKRRETVTVAVIKSVVESSQAEALDLRPGDVIIEYGGIRIHNATQLVKEVKKNSNKDQIELMFVREGNSRRLVLNAGFIGVRITTEKVSSQAYQSFF